jgi:hypothetical protein
MIARIAHTCFAAREILEKNENIRALATGPLAQKSVDDTAAYVLKVVDDATREGQGGRFMNWDGAGIPW